MTFDFLMSLKRRMVCNDSRSNPVSELHGSGVLYFKHGLAGQYDGFWSRPDGQTTDSPHFNQTCRLYYFQERDIAMESVQPWVVVGNEKNWERGFENGIWGLVPPLEHHWLRITPGDLVLFYCVAPVKGFIGAGIIRSKFKQDRPFWEEEIRERRVIWPFRFEFDITHLLPIGKWHSQAVSNRPFNLPILAGINPVLDIQKALTVLEKLKFTIIKPVKREAEIASTILEIGKIQRMVVETQYPVNGDSIDVIWKRTIRSVPTYAFAINLSADLDRSIKPLKHSFDLWNSRPFLVTDKSRVKDFQEVSSGLYHEFSEQLKILTDTQVQNLYHAKKRYFELEREFGLR